MINYKFSSYYHYLNKIPLEVKINKYKEVINLKKEDIRLIKRIRCFKNAFLISRKYNCDYIEGEVYLEDIGIFIIHAWNKYENKYFDITFEKYNFLDSARYFPVVEGGLTELINDNYVFDADKDLFTQYLNRELIR